MTFIRDQQQNYVYSKHAVNMPLQLLPRNCFFTVGRVFWLNQINRHSPKYSESRSWSGLYVYFYLKKVTFLHSFSKQKYVGQAGSDLQFVLAVITKSDSRLTFLFLVVVMGGGRVGPANLNKPEEFSLHLYLIDNGLMLPPGVKVVISTASCDSL